MGGIANCCCGCCSGACSNVIDQIKLTINEGGPTEFTRDLGYPLTRDCYEYLFAGNWCDYITDTKTAVIGCGDRLGFLRDLKVTITHTGSPQPAFEFPCPIIGDGFWTLGKAKVQTTSSGSSHEYYWSTEIFHNSVIDGTYKGTGFTFTGGNNWFGNSFCGTDADLAADIKADLVAALSGTWSEFNSSNFSVTVERNNLSCGSSLGIGSQTATLTGAICPTGVGGATPSCYGFGITTNSIVRGAVVQLAPKVLKLNLLLLKTSTITWGADCNAGGPSFLPRPADQTIYGVSSRGFELSLTPTTCFNSYDFSVSLPSFAASPRSDFSAGWPCTPPTGGIGTSSTATSITGTVELIYA